MKYLISRFLFLLSILFAFSACDKIPDGVVDYLPAGYKIVSIKAPSSFTYSVSDSLVTTSMEVQNVQSVGRIWCAVKSIDGTKTVNAQVDLKDDGNIAVNGDLQKGDNIFSGKFVMSKKLSNGKYQIEYFVEDNFSSTNTVKVGLIYFSYDNGQTNFPPVISNLIIPSSVARGESFTFTLKVEDPNGLADISQVYFKLVRPDGSIVIPGSQDDNGSGSFLMHDDGNTNYGDVMAGDGIYSFKNFFGATSLSGTWRLEFQAKDKGTPSKLSNQITFNMTVN